MVVHYEMSGLTVMAAAVLQEDHAVDGAWEGLEMRVRKLNNSSVSRTKTVAVRIDRKGQTDGLLRKNNQWTWRPIILWIQGVGNVSKDGSEVLNLKSSENKKLLTTTATTKRQGITDVMGRGFRFQNLGLIFIIEICDCQAVTDVRLELEREIQNKLHHGKGNNMYEGCVLKFGT